eukprot:362083-Chlamydomonas_euryale.AAC.4
MRTEAAVAHRTSAKKRHKDRQVENVILGSNPNTRSMSMAMHDSPTPTSTSQPSRVERVASFHIFCRQITVIVKSTVNQAWTWINSTPRLPGRTLGRVAQHEGLPPRRAQDRVIRPTCWGTHTIMYTQQPWCHELACTPRLRPWPSRPERVGAAVATRLCNRPQQRLEPDRHSSALG